jgi:hypothetical protein
VTSETIFIGRRVQLFSPLLRMAIETYLHARPISGDATMSYFGVTNHTIYPHVEMLSVMRIHSSRRSYRIDSNIRQTALYPKLRVLDTVDKAE